MLQILKVGKLFILYDSWAGNIKILEIVMYFFMGWEIILHILRRELYPLVIKK